MEMADSGHRLDCPDRGLTLFFWSPVSVSHPGKGNFYVDPKGFCEYRYSCNGP